MRNRIMQIGIVAGEVSGDRLAAALIVALRKRRPEWRFSGVAGPAMIAAGCEARHSVDEISVMGLAEVVRHFPRLKQLQRSIVDEFLNERPDVFIGVDSPDFVLRIAERLRAAGVKTVQLVSPSVWAWRPARVDRVARCVDLLLSILPNEAAWYGGRSLTFEYVGHPLADEIPLESDRGRARREIGLDEHAPCLLLLPGSRQQELRRHAAPFFQTAQICSDRCSGLRVACAPVDSAAQAWLEETRAHVTPRLALQYLTGGARLALTAADSALVASGTATLEALLCRCPQVIAYRVSRLSHALLRLLVRTPHIGLPNIIAGKEVAPEFVQHRMRPAPMADALLRWLTDSAAAAEYRATSAALHRQLRRDAMQRSAAAVIGLLEADARP